VKKKPNRARTEPRTIAPKFKSGTAERMATANARYVVDIEELGPAGDIPGRQLLGARGIRDRKTGRFDARPGMTKSQVYAEVARLNAGLPVSAVSQGIARKPRTVVAGSAGWWVEILTDAEPTRTILQDALDTGRKLSVDDVYELITYHDDAGVDFRASFPYLPTQKLTLPPRPIPDRPVVTEADERRHRAALAAHEAECARLRQDAENAERTLVTSVLKQLTRAIGVTPADGRNDHRARKRAR
jgi:hypothetical protein